MTRFPYMNLEIMNSGIGGNTAEDMYDRIDGDVFDKLPTVVAVTFGMNDTGYVEYGRPGAKEFGEKRLKWSLENFAKIEKRLLALDGVDVVMIGGSPYDETAIFDNPSWKGKNAVMEKINAHQQETAAKHSWGFVDFGLPMTEISLREQAKDSSFTLSMGDRIHPDNHGHMIMAYLFLKAQGFAGNKVADIQLDGRKGKLISSENCAISEIKKDRRSLSFNYLANSLPYPMDQSPRGFNTKHPQAEAAGLVPFVEEMNQETLKVTGLEGEQNLYIDGELIGTWTAEDFAKGINMAELPWTPQYQQALAVMHINEWRWEIERNFRDYAWMQHGFMKPHGLLNANNRKAVETIDKNDNIWAKIHKDLYSKLMIEDVRETRIAEMEMLRDKMYEINKPVPHKITISKK